MSWSSVWATRRRSEYPSEVIDDTDLGTSRWGAKRAEYGHPEPFKIGYVEIGNEDFFSCTYPYRFSYLYKPLTEAYPEIRFMSTAYKENANGGDNANCKYNISLPSGSAYDLHSYQVSR
jgi:alpha-N-arabinofuranosidase